MAEHFTVKRPKRLQDGYEECVEGPTSGELEKTDSQGSEEVEQHDEKEEPEVNGNNEKLAYDMGGPDMLRRTLTPSPRQRRLPRPPSTVEEKPEEDPLTQLKKIEPLDRTPST